MRPASSRPVHDDRYSNQTHCGANDIKSVWNICVQNPTRQQRQDNEEACVGGVDAPEVCRLEDRTVLPIGKLKILQCCISCSRRLVCSI
jgi:hypothetical protein